MKREARKRVARGNLREDRRRQCERGDGVRVAMRSGR